jgi:hypothetical protein
MMKLTSLFVAAPLLTASAADLPPVDVVPDFHPASCGWLASWSAERNAGEDACILACIIEPNRAMHGLVDAHRYSHDAHRGGLRYAINDALRRYQLSYRWFAIDNDIYYLAANANEVGNVQGGWNVHRAWLSMMGLSGGAALTSDPWLWDVLKPQLRTVETMQPPAKMRSEVLDLGTAKVSWTTPSLEGLACQRLVFTPIDGAASGKPVLVGSSMHISSGVAEVMDLIGSTKGVQVSLTDAGARNGRLFFRSNKPLELTKATGLEACPVEPAGENVWSLEVSDRHPNSA